MTTTRPTRTVRLDDRYGEAKDPVLLNGTHALVRMLLTQRRLDAERSLNTGMFVSGYPGSPLGGLDLELNRNSKLLDATGVVFQPGVNEELAATAVGGTQLLSKLPGRRVDGVTGIWYGKTPGLDRAADAIRHANVSGTSHLGGVVALVGDDPMCKSSTLPGSSESMCRSLFIPLLAPSTVHEIVELGLHAVALSRASGAWSGLKIVSDVADSSATVAFGSEVIGIPEPPRVARPDPPQLLAPSSLQAEHDLVTARWGRVMAYSQDTELNRVVFEPTVPRITVTAAGGTYATLIRAFSQLGIGAAEMERSGIRLVQLRMPWPISPHDVDRFCRGVDSVLVVEDKTPFIEAQLKERLYGTAHAPRILGKHDADGRTLLSAYGSVDVEAVVGALDRILPTEARSEALTHRFAEVTQQPRRVPKIELLQTRTPFFCSGCPHNISTRAAPDRIVGAGIGCHALVAFDPVGARGNLIGAPQMGGEGAHWIGLAPFTSETHFTQNIGDGTFHHSGSLAIRAAVAAGSHVTFRLLYNDAVAMTGGQVAEGRMTVPVLTRWLASEGVKKVVITSDDPGGYRAATLDGLASVRHRDDFAHVEAELAAVEGVTVLIHDDRCATEDRRMRKRNLLPVVTKRVWINERVCEGCGDCGAKSSCLSVIPVDTEFGRKTGIHQASCNSDMSCLEGDCPSFVLVDVGSEPRRRTPPQLPVELVAPAGEPWSGNFVMRMPGVGGTGVVTLSQIVQMAALLDGRYAAGLDQTGLAQKGGAVISDVRISDAPIEGAVRASRASVDLLLGLDPLGTVADATIATCDPARTVAVVNTGLLATAAMAIDPTAATNDPGQTRRAIDRATRRDRNVYVDAQRLSEVLFGDHMPANMILLGVAFQSGHLPLTEASITEAITLNGAAVETNLSAFAWGRAVAADPGAVTTAVSPRTPEAPSPNPRVAQMIHDARMPAAMHNTLLQRVSDLVGYQNLAYARRYLEAVRLVHEREAAVLGPDAHGIAEAVAKGLYKLMAYKDEYEVARLHLLDSERQRLDLAFGSEVSKQVLLHPPILRLLGMRRKVRLGSWFQPVLMILRAGRRLRGTPADLFGATKLRKLERQLVVDYRDVMSGALGKLSAQNARVVQDLALTPDLVRGYEEVKLRNVEVYRKRVAELVGELES